jgi:hypothetical protein
MRFQSGMLLLALCVSLTDGANGQTTPPPNSDARAAIRQTALDYIEGWYSGDGPRMERALHPELAKRMVSTDSKTGKSTLNQMGAMTLVQNTNKGYGTNLPKEQQLKEVTILDVDDDAASVKIRAATWIDYLQLAKWNGTWKIVNVLWEVKPAVRPQ